MEGKIRSLRETQKLSSQASGDSYKRTWAALELKKQNQNIQPFLMATEFAQGKGCKHRSSMAEKTLDK